jgi:serine/threonine protein kinase
LCGTRDSPVHVRAAGMKEAAASAVGGMTETIGLPSQSRLTDEVPPIIPDYRPIKIIGRGAFGTVWLAEEPLAGLYRAIKVLDGGGRGRRATAELANRELAGLHTYQSLAQGHPNLIQVFKTGLCKSSGQPVGAVVPTDPNVRERMVRTTDPTPQASSPKSQASVYYVMEIADHAGGAQPHRPMDYRPLTLSSLIRQRGRLPPEIAIRHGLTLLDTIEHLHKAGIHHRDIKPSNILFVGGALKLADVGLVSDEHGEHVGTTGYLPPEGKPDDLYAFGKVLYEMVTGLPASAFPEWPGDLGPNVAQPPSAVFGKSGASASGAPSATEAHTLTRLRDLINRACHPDAAHRLAKRDELRLGVASCVDKRPQVVGRRTLVLAVGACAVLGPIGIFLGRTVLREKNPYESIVGVAPYDGSEFAQSFEFAGRHMRLDRRHSPRKTQILVDNGTVARFWDIETRVHDGRYEIRGSFQIFNERNPLEGNITTRGGDINQIYLLLGNRKVMLYHGQQGREPGTMSVFGRGIPLDSFISRSGPAAAWIRLTIGCDSYPGAIEETVSTKDARDSNCLEIGLIHSGGDPRLAPAPLENPSEP